MQVREGGESYIQIIGIKRAKPSSMNCLPNITRIVFFQKEDCSKEGTDKISNKHH